MKKLLCDICGKDADMYTSDVETVEKVDKKCDKTAYATCRVVFAFKEHSSGFGGPPDLCSGCKRMMVTKLLTFFGI